MAKTTMRSTNRKTTHNAALVLTAYGVDRAPSMRLVPAPAKRKWMDETDRRYANRCLPLLIANEAGWFLLSAHELQATWSGRNDAGSLQVELLKGEPPCPAVSHFGHGILTWHIPYIFRTPPGYNLLARGPANLPKDAISPLEGIIETDWSEATFTMNWKMTRPNHCVTFEIGEPICMLVPQRKGELEAFHPEVRDLESAPDLLEAHEKWSEQRARFIDDLPLQGSEANRQGWQKHYFRGLSADNQPAPEHETKLRLRDFVDRRS
jgi:hypothetical protein